MDITDLQCGERAVVASVEAPAPLKERLRALNIRTGEALVLLRVSPFRRTYLVQAGSTVAIRREVAQCVKLRKA